MNKDRREQKRYSPTITLGNVISFVTVVGGGIAFWLTDHDKLINVQAAQVAVSAEVVNSARRDTEFRNDVRRSLENIETELREVRSRLDRGDHVRWRDLPPSPMRGR